MLNRIIIFGLIAVIVSSCNRKIQVQQEIENIPFNIKCEKYIHQPGIGIDSEIGTVVCDDISLTYDYGLFSNSKPESMLESFSKSFYAYHYSNFFDAIFIEEKLREVFKDSVHIAKVVKSIVDERYIVNCDKCNATAYLIFNDTPFLYPFMANDKAVENHLIFDISTVAEDNYYKKMYLSKDGHSSGVYIAPLGNPRKNRGDKKLSVTTTHLPSVQLKGILRSIELKFE